jgi:hypothetical protein
MSGPTFARVGPSSLRQFHRADSRSGFDRAETNVYHKLEGPIHQEWTHSGIGANSSSKARPCGASWSLPADSEKAIAVRESAATI